MSVVLTLLGTWARAVAGLDGEPGGGGGRGDEVDDGADAGDRLPGRVEREGANHLAKGADSVSGRDDSYVRRDARRIRKLEDERTKLLDGYYAGAIPLELMKHEQTRSRAHT